MFSRQMRSASLSLCVCGSLVAVEATSDWSQWRGPQRNGIAATTLPRLWPERLRQVWRVDVGVGHSSPVVAGDRVFVFARRGEQEVLAALDLATGKALWQQVYDAPYDMHPAARGHGKGPKSTPVVSNGIVCAFGISGVLSCYDTQKGAVRWRRQFASEFPATAPSFGVAMSPIVEAGALVAHVGGTGRGALRAFDLATGATRWSWEGDGPAYASPVAATLARVRQLVTQTERFIVGIDATSGALLWRVPFTTEYDQNIVTPVVYRDLVIVGGINQPTHALRPTREGATWRADKVWENQTLPMYMSSPVVVGDLLFGLTHRNKGQYFCVDPASGATRWTTEGRQGDNASIVSAGDVLLGLNSEGELVVFGKSAAGFEIVRRYPVAESFTWAHPVPIGSGAKTRILVTDANRLTLWSVS